MPISPGAAGLITAPIGGFLSAMNTAFENRQSRKWSEQMYDRQTQDNLEYWHMQNAYNSPQEQMKRFQAAGLNPNLIYSQGNPGNAIQLSSPDPKRPQFESSRFDAGLGNVPPALEQMYNLEIKKAQLDNMSWQNDNLQKDAEMKTIQMDRARLDYQLDKMYSGDYRRESLRGRTITNDNMISENVRREVALSTTVSEAAERILNMQQGRERTDWEIKKTQETIKLMKQDGRLREFEIMLNRSGVTRQDELWQRLVAAFLSQQGKSPLNYRR